MLGFLPAVLNFMLVGIPISPLTTSAMWTIFFISFWGELFSYFFSLPFFFSHLKITLRITYYTFSVLRITLSPQVTPTPICWEPVSIPMHPSCVAHPVLCNNWMVNGCLHTTEVVFFFSNSSHISLKLSLKSIRNEK